MIHRTTLVVFLVTLFSLLISTEALAQRGCCSHHGGVAYCDRDQGRYVCRDASYSPSCGCEREQPRKDNTKTNDQSYYSPYLTP